MKNVSMKAFRQWCLILLILSMTSLVAGQPLQAEQAGIVEHSDFTSNRWTKGLHLLAGLGVNTAYFKSDLVNKQVGIGLNIDTTVSYFLWDSMAFEVSTNVTFNRLKSVLVWDTLETLGVRVRLPSYLGVDHSTPYLRVFGGKGPSVFLYDSNKPAILEVSGGQRAQVEGDVYGAAYGVFQDSRDGRAWFIEWAATGQFFQKVEAVAVEKDVPEIIASRPVKKQSARYSLSLTLGIVVL